MKTLYSLCHVVGKLVIRAKKRENFRISGIDDFEVSGVILKPPGHILKHFGAQLRKSKYLILKYGAKHFPLQPKSRLAKIENSQG